MPTPVDDDLDFFQTTRLLNVMMQSVTVDPGTPVESQFWYNSTSKLARLRDNAATHTLAYLDAVVNGLTAADGTVTLAGTTTAPTIKVAKTLDHTYVTDFDAQVRLSRLDQMAAPTAAVSANNQTITNVTDPTNPQDAVNLRTLLNNVAGLSASQPAAYATSAPLPTNTYANGASGVGATLTATANGALSVDGQAVAAGQRIVVNNEAALQNNGIYLVTQAGSAGTPYILTRATDFNQNTNVGPGILVPVEAPATVAAGTNNNGKVFLSVTATNPTIGTTGITFTSVGGTYSAGTGLTLTGSTFSLTVPVAVTSGGTGGITAKAARTSLAATTLFAATIGDGAATSIVVNHALNTTDINATAWELGGNKRQIPILEIRNTDANNCTVVFAAAPAANSVRVVVIGIAA